MNIYLSHDLESKLRKWAFEHNSTINSVIIKGLGKILITVDKSPEEHSNAVREVQDLEEENIPCEIGKIGQGGYLS